MFSEWDASENGIIETQVTHDDFVSNWERERSTYRDRMNQRYGSVELPHISEDIVRDNFPYWVNNDTGMYEGVVAPYHANRAVWVCHNCGTYGWKQGDIRELFKCYCCRSRNVTICRSGELSMAIRNSGLGVNMAAVFDQRRLRQREARRARRAARTT